MTSSDSAPCPDDNIIISFVEGALSARERASVEAHMDLCASCRQLLAAMAGHPSGSASTSGSASGGDTEEESHRGSADLDPLPEEEDRSGDDLAKPLLQPGEMVDHFKVMEIIGRGGMGEVYLARDTELGRRVALKMILPKRLGSRRAKERFLFEARATARFAHPNIVTIYAVGEHRGCPYMALEHVEGQTLREAIQVHGCLDTSATIRLGLALAGALRVAHRHKILHRDLTPGNVLMDRDGQPHILDFGLARVLEAGAVTLTLESASDSQITTGIQPFEGTRVGQHGTPAYMSPEQWKGEEVSAAVDIWTLGLLLHELISGTRPYTHLFHKPLTELGAAVSGPDPVPPLDAGAGVPPELERLIRRCLEKQPGARPTAREVVETLEAMIANTAPAEVPQEPAATAGGDPAPALLERLSKLEQAVRGRQGEVHKLRARQRLLLICLAVLVLAALGLVLAPVLG